MEFEQFCNFLPKIELHAHLNGSLSATSLQKLGCSNEEISEYQKLAELQATEKTLNECFKLFKVAHNATKNPQAVYLATKYVIEDFYNDNVAYLELRTTPREEENMSRVEYIESVVKAIEDCDKKIIVKLLLSIDRSNNLKVEENMEVIIKMKEKYPHVIKGVDFSGNPYVGGFNPKLFQKARDSGLFVTLHCAEIKNDKEVEEILKFRPDRIGHGTFLLSNDHIWKLYLDTNIPLECCLTSNVACGTTKSYKEHHLQEWIKNSLPFTLCTDDKGVFGTTLSKELVLACQYFSLKPTDLWDMTLKTISYTFASDEEKTFLTTTLQDWKMKNHF
ncbi:adenosine deaminase-like protein [Tribolium castaneum]|uniref:Adenosine deaminase-like protein n=1 Tax=Tribolium castaneum TaxID=7070 RepID=D6WSK3_TRICA|nr:PREDICTED: adenosine deaminase-like protein [Tribolium castaneum]EFA07116.1 Adenosine deaminase-like protein [Tribolium castaneum]|eukprot:XP_008196291.1 PREDICTED: adenosine deaminase-like protein [Tribolium castaneum]